MWNLYKQGGITPAISSVFNSQNAHQVAYIRSMMKNQRQHSFLSMPLDSLEIVVFDLETTGFRPKHGDEIISFGGVGVIGGELIEGDTFYSLVRTVKSIPPHIEQLTGIKNEMTKDAPEIIDVLRNFLSFVKKRVLIAHGTGHDKQFLNQALWKTSRATLTHRVLDTMMIAKWLHPNLDHYGLDPLLDLYGIKAANRHHALEDAKMTSQLWACFLQEIKNRQVITLGDLYAYLSQR